MNNTSLLSDGNKIMARLLVMIDVQKLRTPIFAHSTACSLKKLDYCIIPPPKDHTANEIIDPPKKNGTKKCRTDFHFLPCPLPCPKEDLADETLLM